MKLKTVRKTVNGALKEKDILGYQVPLKASLEKILSMPEVWQFVNRSHQSTGQMMLDICDGQYFRTHPLFSRNRKALQLIINNDDIEIVNPIGSHTKNTSLVSFTILWVTYPQNLDLAYMPYNSSVLQEALT